MNIWWNPGLNGPWEPTLFLCSQLLFGSFPGHSGCQPAEFPARQTVRDNWPKGPTGGCSAQSDQSYWAAPWRSAEALGTAAGSLCSPQREVAREAAAPTAGKKKKRLSLHCPLTKWKEHSTRETWVLILCCPELGDLVYVTSHLWALIPPFEKYDYITTVSCWSLLQPLREIMDLRMQCKALSSL